MRLDPEATQDELLRQLEREAEAAWGPARLAALRPTLQATAEALSTLLRSGWRVADWSGDAGSRGLERGSR